MRPNETQEEWEEWTPARPFETRSLHCHDCNESAEWKGENKLIRGDDNG